MAKGLARFAGICGLNLIVRALQIAASVVILLASEAAPLRRPWGIQERFETTDSQFFRGCDCTLSAFYLAIPLPIDGTAGLGRRALLFSFSHGLAQCFARLLPAHIYFGPEIWGKRESASDQFGHKYLCRPQLAVAGKRFSQASRFWPSRAPGFGA